MSEIILPSSKKVVKFKETIIYGDVRKYEQKKSSLLKTKEDNKIDFSSYIVADSETLGMLVCAMVDTIGGEKVTEETHDSLEIEDGTFLALEVKKYYEKVLGKKNSQDQKK